MRRAISAIFPSTRANSAFSSSVSIVDPDLASFFAGSFFDWAAAAAAKRLRSASSRALALLSCSESSVFSRITSSMRSSY
ncbi:hypothetical protein D3C83_67990 [compost metagenome]